MKKSERYSNQRLILMESSSETNQSSIQGYSTPPRSNITSKPTFSQLFHQPKILTSAELKRRFSSIKKRRHNLIRKSDSIVPLERNLNMPVILEKLFANEEELSPKYLNKDDCVVPISSIKSSKRIVRQSIFDYLKSNSFKIEQENAFSISETILKEKLKILLQKK